MQPAGWKSVPEVPSVFASPASGNSVPGVGHSPHSCDPTEHSRACAEVHCSLPNTSLKELKWAQPPQVPHLSGGVGKTLRFSPVLAKQQARHITQQEQPPGLKPGVQEGTTQLTHKTTGFGEGWGKSPLSPLVLITGYFPIPQTIPGLGHIKANKKQDTQD